MKTKYRKIKTTIMITYKIWNFVDMCGVEGKRRLCDLNVTSSSPALATRHIRCVLLVNSPNKLNLHVLSWLLIQARVQGGGPKGPGAPHRNRKERKKKPFRFWAPPPLLRIPGHAPVIYLCNK